MRLRAFKITGRLDLRSATIHCPLELEDCYFESAAPVNLDYAKVSLLTLRQCYLPGGLTGDTLVIEKGLDLTGSRFTGPVWLPDADIRGHFRCTGARLFTTVRRSPPDAVRDDRGALQEYGPYALVADGIKVSGDVRLDGEFTAVGVLLSSACIGDKLDCTGAILKAAADGYCLRASRVQVGGNLILDECTTEGGGIRLSSAKIAGELLCHGSQLKGGDKGGNALRANEITIGSNVIVADGFTADGGKISLRQSVIGANLQLEPDRLGEDLNKVAFDATGTQIAQNLSWRPATQIRGKVILEQVTVGQLEDCWKESDGNERPNGFWPTGGMLRLDGLTYGGISSAPDDEMVDVDKRLEWIRSQYRPVKPGSRSSPAVQGPASTQPGGAGADFATQPYQQLANVYLAAGRDAEARKVAIARRRDLRAFGRLSRPAWLGNWLLDNTIRYGYRTWRAAVGLAILYAFVAVFFSYARFHGGVIPVQTTPNLKTNAHVTAASCTSDYPCFNPYGYAIDTVIPLINVHQADFWSPAGLGPVLVTYLGTGFGWLFATLAVAGYTGLVRNSASP